MTHLHFPTRFFLSCTVAILLWAPNLLKAQDSSSEGENQIETVYVRQMESLAKTKSVKQAFQTIEELEPRTLEELIMLTEIPAPPFKEEKRAAKFADMLQEAGVDSVWIDKVGNVIGLRKGKTGQKTIALDAHIDTVFPEGTDVTVERRGDTLVAPGIGDDTRGLMVVLTVLRALEINDIETEDDVLFIGTVGEEGLGDLRGVKHLFSEEGPGIDSWMAVDGGSISRIINGALGSYRYRVTFKGPGGHSWGNFGMVNPHHALGKAIYHFSKDADSLSRTPQKVSFNIGRIGGGTSINSIPFESWMEVDMRSAVPEQLDKMDAIFQKAIQKAVVEENEAKRSGANLEVDINQVGERPSGKIAPSEPLVQKAMASAAFFGANPFQFRLILVDFDSGLAK